ncbi:MAG: hypothetical protein R3Y68_00065 [Rikenellaceae bacterium]
MESNQSFELVGGITRVVLHLASTPLPDIGEVGESSFEVTLEAGVASYVERQTLEATLYRVHHTLAFQCEHADSPLDDEQMKLALRDGVVADVTLGTGATIRVGWSERFELAAPLRLQSVEFASGESRVDYPLRSWVWSSIDSDTLI